MGRKARPVALTPAERAFRLDEWVDRHLLVEAKSGPEWLCVCPACGRTKLAVHVGRKAYRCLSAHCGIASWRPVNLVRVTLGVSRDRAQEIVAAFGIGVDLGPVQALLPSMPPRMRAARDLPGAPLPAVAWELLPTQQAYVRERGIPVEHAEWFGLATILADGSFSKADRHLAGRVLFPIWGPRGRIVFWVARAVGESTIKTYNTPRSCREPGHSPLCTCYHDLWGLQPVPEAATADEVVLGIHLVRPGEPVILVEGPVDAAVCGPGFVATLRAWCSPQQAAWIAAAGASEVIILYDGDEAGRVGARKAADVLRTVLPTRIAQCPEDEDPGSLGRSHALRIAYAAPREGVGQLPAKRYTQIPKVSRTVPLVGPLGLKNQK